MEIGDHRDVTQLRRMAELLAEDLARALDVPLRCEVRDDYGVVLYHGDGCVTIALDPEINEEWFSDRTEPHPDSADWDASEAIWDALSTGVSALAIDPPRCVQHHDNSLTVCCGLWVCGGGSGTSHSIEIGLLGVAP